MKNSQSTLNLILRAVAVGMAAAAITLGFLGADVETQVSLLAIGLFALAVAAMRQEEIAAEKR